MSPHTKILERNIFRASKGLQTARINNLPSTACDSAIAVNIDCFCFGDDAIAIKIEAYPLHVRPSRNSSASASKRFPAPQLIGTIKRNQFRASPCTKTLLVGDGKGQILCCNSWKGDWGVYIMVRHRHSLGSNPARSNSLSGKKSRQKS